MLRFMLKTKIHRATVTEANVAYEGSITIDRDLMDAAGIIPFEQVGVYNINNGERFETYVIEGDKGSGVMGLNGAAARKGLVGDRIIVVTYVGVTEDEIANHEPVILLMDDQNKIKQQLSK